MEEKKFTRINANSMLTLIGNTKGSLKARKNTLINISETKLYPEIFSTPHDFLENCIAPIVSCFDDDSDSIRDNSVQAVTKLLKQLKTNNPDEIYRIVIDKVFYAIDKETTEEISLLLVQLIRDLCELTNENTLPTKFDEFCPKALLCLSKKLKERNPDMLKLSCSTISSLILHCSQECLNVNASVIVPQLLNTVSHNQLAVRKQALLVLADYLVASGSVHSIDQFMEKQEKMVQDSKQIFRTALVHFCEELLTKHAQRQSLYGEHLYPLLVSLAKLVPKRPIHPIEEIKPIEETKELKEAIAAYDALCKIGEQYKKDDPFLKDHPGATISFDEKRTYGIGLLTLVQNFFKRYLNRILDNLTNFKSDTRALGFAALTSLLHLAHEYSSRYAPQIIPSLVTILIEHPDESESTLRCIALMASLTPLADINEIVLPKINQDCSSKAIEAYSVCLLNSPCTDDDLDKAISSILASGIFKITDDINATAQCVLAVCKRNESYRESHKVDLIHLMLRLGENGDALPLFKDCFNKPLDQVMGENIRDILEIKAKTPRYITQVLTWVPKEAITAENELVCETIISGLKGYQSRTTLYHLLAELCNKGALKNCSNELLQSVLDSMIWAPATECIPTREAATSALGALIKTGVLPEQMVQEKSTEIFAMSLSSLDDQSSDLVRSAAIVTIREVVMHTKDVESRFDRLFDALKERLADSLIPVRLGAADLLCTLLPKCTENKSVASKLSEVVVFMDDESVEMRNSISRFCETVAAFPQWKNAIIEALNNLVRHNYHPEAEILAKQLLSKLN